MGRNLQVLGALGVAGLLAVVGGACTEPTEENGGLGGATNQGGRGGSAGAGGLGGTGGEAGHGGGAGFGGEGGTAGSGGEGGEAGGGGVGTGPACNLLDLSAGGDRCEECVGDALDGPCASQVNVCAVRNPAVLICANLRGCMRMGESPPVDLVCMATDCQVELLQLNACLMECIEFEACFL